MTRRPPLPRGRTTRRSHHRPAPLLPIVGADHPGTALEISIAQLELGLPLRPFTAQYLGECDACKRTIAPGDTTFVSGLITQVPPFRLCWECGTGLMLEHGYYTESDIRKIPPIGGAPG